MNVIKKIKNNKYSKYLVPGATIGLAGSYYLLNNNRHGYLEPIDEGWEKINNDNVDNDKAVNGLLSGLDLYSDMGPQTSFIGEGFGGFYDHTQTHRHPKPKKKQVEKQVEKQNKSSFLNAGNIITASAILAALGYVFNKKVLNYEEEIDHELGRGLSSIPKKHNVKGSGFGGFSDNINKTQRKQIKQSRKRIEKEIENEIEKEIVKETKKNKSNFVTTTGLVTSAGILATLGYAFNKKYLNYEDVLQDDDYDYPPLRKETFIDDKETSLNTYINPVYQKNDDDDDFEDGYSGLFTPY
jgi:hypothetical protein